MADETLLQRSILGVTQALFDATPGSRNYYTYSQMVTQGMSVPLLMLTLIKSTDFNNAYTYSSSLSLSAFATQFINDVLGDRAADADKLAAADYVVSLVNTGMSRSDAMSNVFGVLLSVSNDNARWGTAAAYYKAGVIAKILDNLVGNSAAAAATKAELNQYLIDNSAQDGSVIATLTAHFVSVADNLSDSDVQYGVIAQRFHNKLDASSYYSLKLQQSATAWSDLQSIIAPITESPVTLTLAKMKIAYYAGKSSYAADTMVVTSNIDVTGIDTTSYQKLIVNVGGAGVPRATVTMRADQVVALSSVTKGSGDKLAVVDSIDNINAYAGLLGAADSRTGLVPVGADLSGTDLTQLTGLKVDDGASTSITVTVTAAQASALFGSVAKGSGDKLAVVDSISNINAALNLSVADRITGVTAATVDLSTANLTRLTDLQVGVDPNAPINVTLLASQATKLKGHINKVDGNTLTLICVPSEVSTLPSLADTIIVNVTVSRDLRTLDLTKCISMTISDSTSASISATLLAAQAESLVGHVTKGISDKLVVDDSPANVLAATDLSAADFVYATDLSGGAVTISETDLGRITGLRAAGPTTLTDATSAGFSGDVAKITLSGGGTLSVEAAPGNLVITQAAMATVASLTAQSDASVTVTEAISTGLSALLRKLHISGTGQINLIGATGANLAMSEADLALVSMVLAAANANISLTDVSSAGLAGDLAKLTVSGTGGVIVTGALGESFTLTEDALLDLKSLTTKGSGTITITGVRNANLVEDLTITAISGTGSVSITGVATDDLTITSTSLNTEPVSSVTAGLDRFITLSGATSSKLATDLAKLHVSGTGKINIVGASGQNFSFLESALGGFGSIAATGTGGLSISGVTAANFATDLTILSVASGIIDLALASSQGLAVTHTQLLNPIRITAASGDNLWLSGATGASLTSDLSKLRVSGGGAIDVTGALNENLSITAAGLANVSGLHATGTGSITVTSATASAVDTLLNKLSITGSGTATLTFTDSANAAVSAAAANNRKIIASDVNGSITIANAPGGQTFYASAGTSGTTTLTTKAGDSTASTATCDVLNVIPNGKTMVGLSGISADGTLWNVGTAGKATALDGTGLVLDLAKYDVYIATVGGSDYLVYETAVDGTSYEIVKIVGTVNPATMQMSSGILSF